MKEKLKASAIHLSISAFIIGVFFLFVLTVWYPAPYFQVSGLIGIMLMLVAIDLIIGPLLTFIVFKPKKPSLKFDLSVIAAIQIVALAYGAMAVYEGHPVYVAYTVDRFTLVSVGEADPEKAKYKEFNVSTYGVPKIVYAKMPEKNDERNDLMFSAISGGKYLEHHAEYYEPIEKYTDKIVKRSIAVDKILAYPKSKKQLESFLEKQGKEAKEFAFLPLMGKEKVMLWALDRKDGKPVGVIDIDPWELGKS
ncbi:MAG: hypothetical protein KAG34_04085 [Cocleimonas sp.]|nr:hypothetical protein [Cocleimonas sp.]